VTPAATDAIRLTVRATLNVSSYRPG